MKGQLSVDPIYKPLGIVRPTVYLKNPVVAYDNHRLHFKGKSISWDSTRNIINCTYSEQYGTLMVLCDDWKLSVYNQNLQQIGRLLNWESKFTVGFQYLQKLGLMLLISVSSVQILKMNIVTNIKKTKFLSSVKFGIEKKQLIRQNKKHKLKWNKGYGYDLENMLLFVWSLQDINFYSLNRIQSNKHQSHSRTHQPQVESKNSTKEQKIQQNTQKTMQLKSIIRNLVKKQQPITFVYFNSSYKYTVTGLFNGNVRVWRLPLVLSSTFKQVNNKDYIMIHNCLYHTKQVEKIVATEDDRVILSQSADLTVCLWSLQTFQLLRVYDFEGEYQKVMLYDHQGALGIRDNMLGEIKFGKTMQFIRQLNNGIISHDKAFQFVHKMQGNSQKINKITKMQLTLSSNMGLQIDCQTLRQKDLNKIQVGVFYPPLKSQEIKQVISCPFTQNRYYLLQQMGKIYKLRMDGLSSIIEHYYSVNLTHDIENHPLNQLPTLIKFLQIIPTEFDSEIIESAVIEKQLNTGKNNNQNQNASLQQKFQQLKLIAIGCNRGSIVFLPVDNMDHIYTRITYHRQEIVAMQTVNQEEIQNSYLISICKEKFMRFVKFQNERAHCFRTISLGDSFNFIRGFQDRLAVVLHNGLFEVMKFDVKNNDELYTINNYEAMNHEGDILSLDVDLEKQIILTAGKDNKIKIWTYYKIQLYEICLDEGLKYAIFSNNYEILVSHGLKLLYIRDIPFSVTKQEIDLYNSEFLQNNQKNKLTIKEFLEQKFKKKQFVTIKQEKYNPKQQKILDQNILNIEKQYDEIKLSLMTNSKKLQNKGNSGRKYTNFTASFQNQINFGRKSFAQTARKTKKKSSLKERPNSLNKQRSDLSSFSTHRDSSFQNEKFIDIEDILMTKKHLQEMQKLKKQTNKPLLPRIAPKQEDIFQSFMKDKLLNKKVLTRRDITLNRIIMKNIVKQNIGQSAQTVIGLKLDF